MENSNELLSKDKQQAPGPVNPAETIFSKEEFSMEGYDRHIPRQEICFLLQQVFCY
jgi:hypothetical protein